MSDKINLKMDEINAVSTALATFHESKTSSIQSMLDLTRQIIGSDDIFSAKGTSTNIESILQLFESEVFSLLKNAFESSESAIDTEISSMTGYDV